MVDMECSGKYEKAIGVLITMAIGVLITMFPNF